MYINGAQYFDGVPKEVWEFQIGGYQVCEKWLKDRKLSSDDIDHYQKIVVVLAETIRLMREIDEIIPGVSATIGLVLRLCGSWLQPRQKSESLKLISLRANYPRDVFDSPLVPQNTTAT